MAIVHVKGIDIYYEVHGEGKESLLLISGLSCDNLVWSPVLPDLAKRYRVIVFDNRGVGRTEAPPELYTVEQMAEDAAALLSALKIDNTHVLGHSLGGAIAQTLAVRHSNVVDKLILCCTSMKFRTIACKFNESILALRKNGNSISLLVDVVLPWLYSENFIVKDTEIKVVRERMIKTPYPQTIEGFAGQLHAAKTFNSIDWVSKITNPTLVIAGSEDSLCPRDGLFLAKAIKDARYEKCLHTGHFPFVENPRKFVKIVSRFLKS